MELFRKVGKIAGKIVSFPVAGVAMVGEVGFRTIVKKESFDDAFEKAGGTAESIVDNVSNTAGEVLFVAGPAIVTTAASMLTGKVLKNGNMKKLM